MNFKIIKVVIGREYLIRVKKKSFLITTFVVPVLFAMLCCIPALILLFSKGQEKHIGVIDQTDSTLVMASLEDTKLIKFKDYTGNLTIDELKEQRENLDLDAVLLVEQTGTGTAMNVDITTFSPKPISVDNKEIIESQISAAVEDYRLKQYDIEGLKQIIEDVKCDVDIKTYTVDDEGGEKISSSEVYMIISMILAMIIYMFISMFCGTVMQSVIEEKSSRVVEVLVSSIKATDLLLGKIVGVALVALTQFFLWIVLTLVLVTGFNAIIGFDSLAKDGAATEQMMEMAGGDALGINVEDVAAAAASAEGAEAGSELSVVLETLKDIDYGTLVISFFVFFILGYLLYASLFAAVGSAVDNEADTQQLTIPLTVPLMLAFFVGIYSFNAPDSQLVWWFSMIPFTSPIVMLARIPLGVATWEIVLSVALLFFTFLGCAWVSAKIYKVGILMFGKKSTFKDLWKWLKMK